MVAPVAHAVQTLSVGWKTSEVCAEWVTAAGAVLAAIFAAWAVVREGRLLETAQEQVKVSQQQIEAMQEQARIARDQVEASTRPVVLLEIRKNDKPPAGFRDIYMVNLGSGPAPGIEVHYPSRPSEKMLNPLGAGADGPYGSVTAVRWNAADILYRSISGTDYKTQVTFRAGRFEQTVTRVERYAAAGSSRAAGAS